MTFTAHKNRRVYPVDLYNPPDQPHCIHFANFCTDHQSCPWDHWRGGRPERNWPHYVEYDGETGQWGYTRLNREEIADLKRLEAYEAEIRANAAAVEAERRKIILDRAAEDPAFRALVEHLGIK